MKNKKQLRKNNLSPVILVASFFLLILVGFLYSKPFKIPKEVEAVVGTLNLNTGGSTFTPGGIWNANGAVGIGTTSPSSSLHIVTASAQTNSPTAGISMGKSAGGDYQLQLTQSGGSPLIDLSRGTNTDFDARISSPADNQLSFGTYSGGNVLNIVAGNVGIGTASPGYTLDVNGPIRALGSSVFAQSANSSTSYGVAPIQIREALYGATGAYLPPRLSFHWGGVVASQIGIESSGRIAILNNPGTGYENLISNSIYFTNNNTRLYQGAGTSLHVQTAYGYVQIGAQNSSWTHFQADRNFYFNPSIYVDGGICLYQGSNCITWDGTYMRASGYLRAASGIYSDGWVQSAGLSAALSYQTNTSATLVRLIYNGIHTMQNGANYDLEIQSAYHGAPTGRVQIGSGGAWSPSLYVFGPVYASAFTGTSDIRLKENIHNITNALNTIKSLRGVTFRWKNNGFDLNNASNPNMNPNSIGFIAQEVETFLPQVVETPANGYKSINYNAIVPIAVTAIQEQQTQIVSLQSITTDFISKFKEGLIETKKLIVDGVDILKKLNELSVKVESQQKQIEELKKSIEEVKNRSNVIVAPGF